MPRKCDKILAMSDFKEKLKELRKNNGYFQKDIAKALNIEINTYGAWERGNSEPSIDIIRKLADFYNVSTDYLFDREEEDGRIIIQEPELPSDEKKLLEEYRALSPELKALSRDYFNSLNALNKNNIRNNDN